VETFALALNTAVLVGSDVLRLLAWVHAEGEAHGYVEADQVGWVAGLVEEGLATGLLRAAAGWPEVVEVLRNTDRPVVLSVDGHGWFSGDAGDAPPWLAWGAAPDSGRVADGTPDWPAALDRLRADAAVSPLTPATLRQPYGHGLTVLDLITPDWQRRLASPDHTVRGGRHS
jgi:hypothetical protein